VFTKKLGAAAAAASASFFNSLLFVFQFICINISLYQKSCKGRKSSFRTSFLEIYFFFSRFFTSRYCYSRCCLNFFLPLPQFSKDYSTNNQDVFIIIFDYRLLCLMFFLFSFDSPQHIAIVLKSTRTWERRVALRRDG
jgi:hypothetical protein